MCVCVSVTVIRCLSLFDCVCCLQKRISALMQDMEATRRKEVKGLGEE